MSGVTLGVAYVTGLSKEQILTASDKANQSRGGELGREENGR